jgi:ribosome-binding protein aMBF1 (putative translation factor)
MGYQTCEVCRRRRGVTHYRIVRGTRLRICDECEDLTWQQAEQRSKKFALTEGWKRLQEG